MKPYVVSIAGFDPSAGAGVLADVKTFEQTGVYGFGVCSALTFQSDEQFEGVQWVSEENIVNQLAPLFKDYEVSAVKFGVVESFSLLSDIVDYVKERAPRAALVWDPVMKTSTGFSFHQGAKPAELERVGRKLTVITPNIDELAILMPHCEGEDAARELSTWCPVYLKGGHGKGELVRDELYYEDDLYVYEAKRILKGEKHGSGCVLSSALCAALAKGALLEKACVFARDYTRRYLQSSSTLLGYHANGGGHGSVKENGSEVSVHYS